MNNNMAALLRSAQDFVETFADVPVFAVQISTVTTSTTLQLQTEPAHLRTFSPMYGQVHEEKVGTDRYLSIQVGNVTLTAVELRS